MAAVLGELTGTTVAFYTDVFMCSHKGTKISFAVFVKMYSYLLMCLKGYCTNKSLTKDYNYSLPDDSVMYLSVGVA